MSTFRVIVTEISKATIEVEANSHEEAVKKAENEYWHNPAEYLLEPENTFFE